MHESFYVSLRTEPTEAEFECDRNVFTTKILNRVMSLLSYIFAYIFVNVLVT